MIIEENTLLEPGSIYSNNSTHVSVYETDDLTSYMRDIGLTVVAPSRILMDAFVKSVVSGGVDINLVHVGKLDKSTIIKTSKWTDQADDVFGKLYYVRYNTVLWFNPSNIKEDIDKFIKQYAQDNKVTILLGNTIYDVMDKYKKYIELLDIQMTEKYPTVFENVQLQIIPKFIFLKKTPLMFGVTVKKGRLTLGSEIKTGNMCLGKVIGLKLDKKDVTIAETGTDVCVKLSNPDGYVYEQDFNCDNVLINLVSDSDLNLRRKYNITP
jgi:translation initiation factor IF-2